MRGVGAQAGRGECLCGTAQGVRVQIRSVCPGERWGFGGWGGGGGVAAMALHGELGPNQGEGACARTRGILAEEAGDSVSEPDGAEEGICVGWTEDSSGLMRDVKRKRGTEGAHAGIHEGAGSTRGFLQ